MKIDSMEMGNKLKVKRDLNDNMNKNANEKGNTEMDIEVKNKKIIANKKPLYEILMEKMVAEYSGKSYLSILPGERELCEIYGVSRPTVRKALEIMAKNKLIKKVPGKGSFFVGNEIKVEDKMKMSKYHQSSLFGDYTKSKVIMQRIEKIEDEEIATNLKMQMGEVVFHLERLRYVGETLASISCDYVPYHICKEMLNVDFNHETLFDTLEHYGVRPYCGRKIVGVEKADEYTAMQLGIELDEPTMVFKTVTVDEGGNPVAYNITRSLAYDTTIEMLVYR